MAKERNETETRARAVDGKWQDPASGATYATSRFGSRRARERDGRLFARVARRAGLGALEGAVLDAPCGTGRMAAPLARALGPGALWIGADVSREMVAEVPRGAGAALRASIFQLPFADASFGVVVCCRFLHHHPDPAVRRSALAELARVSHGWVVASYWDAACWKARRITRRSRARGTRVPVRWSELCADLAAVGLVPTARAFSLRFVSPQAWFAARVRAPEPGAAGGATEAPRA